MKQIKMIGIDMDGTLLTTDKRLTAHTKEVLCQAIRQGVEIVAATGRPHTGIPEEYREIPGLHYAITANGARVVNLVTGEVVYEALVPRKKAEEVLKLFSEYDMVEELYKDGQSYLNRAMLDRLPEFQANPHMVEYIRTTRKQMENVWDLLDQYPDGFEKVQALFKNEADRDEAKRRVEKLGDVRAVSSLDYNVEVSRADANKGSSLMILAEKLGLSPEEVMGFGDNDNDLEMIQKAGLGVAMQNAIPEVKEAADYITDTNDREGVAKAIEKFVLAGEAAE